MSQFLLTPWLRQSVNSASLRALKSLGEAKMNKKALKILGLALSAWIVSLSTIPGPAGAQGMLGGVDLSSPAFTKAELTRADVEERALLREIQELKGLRRAVKSGTLDDPDGSAKESQGAPAAASNAKSPDLNSPARTSPPPLAQTASERI